MSNGLDGHVVVVGSAHSDTVLRVPTIPASGETLLARGVSAGLGGKGANQALAAAAAGASVSFVGAVGSDPVGEQILSSLNYAGIDTSGVETIDAERTGGAYVMVDDAGTNAIVVNSGANGALRNTSVKRAFDTAEPTAVVLVQCEIPPEVVEDVVHAGRAQNLRVVLNLAPYVSLSRDSVSTVSLLVVNESEARGLMKWPSEGPTPAAADIAREIGTACIVTLGEDGSVYAEPDGIVHEEPAYPVTTVVDTTGAGDSYVGTLAAELARGASIEKAMAAASEAAALIVGVHGAQRVVEDFCVDSASNR